jgi:hypothetical protein
MTGRTENYKKLSWAGKWPEKKQKIKKISVRAGGSLFAEKSL